MSNHYDTLGIDKKASPKDIKEAYRKLAKTYHPDINKESDAEKKFKKVSEAYETLSDEQKRSMYDMYGTTKPNINSHGMRNPFSGFGGMDEVISNFMHRSTSRQPRPYIGEDIKLKVVLSLEDVLKEVSREISYSRNERCSICKNTGIQPGKELVDCPMCNGTGQFVNRSRQGNMVMQQVVPCPTCQGVGKRIDEKDKCVECSGNGYTTKDSAINVTIPKGVEDNMVLKMEGRGHCGINGGPSGSAYVVITVEPHKIYDRDGEDLHIKLNLTLSQAVLGCSIDVPTIDRKSIVVDIPPGIQSGTRIIRKLCGCPVLYNEHKGDLYIDVLVKIPQIVDENEKDLFEQIQKLEQGDFLIQNKDMIEYLEEIKK